MIPVLTLWLNRKYRNGLLVGLLLFAGTLSAQDHALTYSIVYKNDVVGTMRMNQKKTKDNIHFHSISRTKMRLVFSVEVHTEEESQFKNGKLVYSTVSRNINGKDDPPKRTKLNQGGYQKSSGTDILPPHKGEITYNLNYLYFREPSGVRQVYSDYFQQFVPIIKKGTHHYRIDLPDGNYNDYIFTNGVCSEVQVHHSLYTIYLRLTT